VLGKPADLRYFRSGYVGVQGGRGFKPRRPDSVSGSQDLKLRGKRCRVCGPFVYCVCRECDIPRQDSELMRAETEILIQPYGLTEGKSIAHRLIEEFASDRWSQFRGAIHFAKHSGHYRPLFDAIGQFLERGGTVELTFGADVFGKDNFATELAAIRTLLEEFEGYQGFGVHLYHEASRTFHPKLYLFSRDPETALLFVGSSNWSEGGFLRNVEANALITLDLSDDDHRKCYDEIVNCFESYWQEAE
jgi:hypothetical protein